MTLDRSTHADPAPPDPGVSARTAKLLHDAMERLLTGRPQRSDGRLIKDNLWKEAGVSRATMNRCRFSNSLSSPNALHSRAVVLRSLKLVVIAQCPALAARRT